MTEQLTLSLLSVLICHTVITSIIRLKHTVLKLPIYFLAYPLAYYLVDSHYLLIH